MVTQNHTVSESDVFQNAAGTHNAIGSDAGRAEELNARLNDGALADGNLGRKDALFRTKEDGSCALKTIDSAVVLIGIAENLVNGRDQWTSPLMKLSFACCVSQTDRPTNRFRKSQVSIRQDRIRSLTGLPESPYSPVVRARSLGGDPLHRSGMYGEH